MVSWWKVRSFECTQPISVALHLLVIFRIFNHVPSFFSQVVLRYAFTKQMANVLGLELPVVDHAMYAKIAIGRTWHDVRSKSQ